MSLYDDPFAPEEPWAEGRSPALGLPARPAAGGGSTDALPGVGSGVAEEVETALADLERYVNGARGSGLSSQVRLDRDHILELIRAVRDRLPVALRSARWIIKERDSHMERARREAAELMDEVRNEAARMVHRTEIVKQAEVRARRIVEAAEEQARRQRLELEDYCDEHLARFEESLERALGNVRQGRRKLQGTEPPAPPPPVPDDDSKELFFDQDQV